MTDPRLSADPAGRWTAWMRGRVAWAVAEVRLRLRRAVQRLRKFAAAASVPDLGETLGPREPVSAQMIRKTATWDGEYWVVNDRPDRVYALADGRLVTVLRDMIDFLPVLPFPELPTEITYDTRGDAP